MFTPSLIASLAQLKTLGVEWFDDNPAAWQGPTELLGHSPSSWDMFGILGYQFIGDAKGKIGTKLDVKHRTGDNGATLTVNGMKDTTVDITLYFFTPADLAAYIRVVRHAFGISNYAGAAPALPFTPVDSIQIDDPLSSVPITIFGPNTRDSLQFDNPLSAFPVTVFAPATAPPKQITRAISVQNPRLAIHQAASMFLFEVSLIDPPQDHKPAMAHLYFHRFMSPGLGGAAIAATPDTAIASNVPGVPNVGNLKSPQPPVVRLPGTTAPNPG